MKKIKLDLNQLKVNSFETAERGKIIGTVKGNTAFTCHPISGCDDYGCIPTLDKILDCPKDTFYVTCERR